MIQTHTRSFTRTQIKLQKLYLHILHKSLFLSLLSTSFFNHHVRPLLPYGIWRIVHVHFLLFHFHAVQSGNAKLITVPLRLSKANGLQCDKRDLLVLLEVVEHLKSSVQTLWKAHFGIEQLQGRDFPIYVTELVQLFEFQLGFV